MLKHRIAGSSKLHRGSLVSATTRSLLKLDQAYIAVGGRDHLTLIVDTLRDIALSRELDPPRCKGAELRCRGA